MRVFPPPLGRMSVISALRPAIFSTTVPECSSSTSITTVSYGSRRLPSSSSRNSTRGRLMPSSKPSRRMVSISTPSCNSPRPATSKLSLSSLSVTRMATFDSASRSSRSRIMRLVTLVPSRPASGLSLTAKRIDRVGGSIGWACSGSVTEGTAMVLDTVVVVRPAIETMSPALTSSTGTRSSPR